MVKALTALQTCATRSNSPGDLEKWPVKTTVPRVRRGPRPTWCISVESRSNTTGSSIRRFIGVRRFSILRLEALKTRKQPYTYGRRATPTTRALEDAIVHLEGGAATILTSSGLGAVSTAILAFVQAGDHILIVDSVYQPARSFADRMLKRLGVETTYYDPAIGAGVAKHFKPNTRLIIVESPGSQTFEMQDIPAIAAAAHAKDIWVIADNTWATPLYCKPLALGADVSIQAATKYIVGHADAMLGAVTANARAARLIDNAKEALGTCPGSEETYLGLRGLRTLDVRLERHQRSGVAVAEWLADRPEVDRVLHPALPNHPGHALWKRDFTGSTRSLHDRSEAGAGEISRGISRRPQILRHGVFVGRLREPRHSIRPDELPDGDQMDRPRPRAPLSHRTRGRR